MNNARHDAFVLPWDPCSGPHGHKTWLRCRSRVQAGGPGTGRTVEPGLDSMVGTMVQLAAWLWEEGAPYSLGSLPAAGGIALCMGWARLPGDTIAEVKGWHSKVTGYASMKP